ncbi:MAG: hypothetical protein D4S01_08885 [Dehalococcoidia bacterium]|nr:MAG: hypothetical protein D4S01_08885 [Dehalococcoidia bacterium]
MKKKKVSLAKNKVAIVASEKYSLNKADLLKISKGAGIAMGGALLAYLLQILPNVEFGEYTAVVVAILSILINAGLKYFNSIKSA